MGNFFACFRIKNREGQKTHLVSKSVASKNRDVLVTKNQLTSVFLCEEKDCPKEKVERLSLQQNFDKETDEDLKDEVEFLKSCGTLQEKPVEIRKSPQRTITQTLISDEEEPLNFHSKLLDTSCKKLHLDEQPERFPDNAKEVEEKSGLPESKLGSFISENHQTQKKIVWFDEGDKHIFENESVDLSHKPENQLQQLDSDASPYRTPLSLSEEMYSPGIAYTPKSIGNSSRIQTQYVYPVLNPVQNLSQWKELREGASHSQSIDHFEQQVEIRPQNKLTEEVGFEQETPNIVVSSLSHWLKPPTLKNFVRERSPSGKSPDTERPIIGLVAAHWSDSDTSRVSPKGFDGNGIPNSTNKYKEDQKVNWHATPFEERLEKALSDEKLFPRRDFSSRTVKLDDDEGEESDTAAS